MPEDQQQAAFGPNDQQCAQLDSANRVAQSAAETFGPGPGRGVGMSALRVDHFRRDVLSKGYDYDGFGQGGLPEVNFSPLHACAFDRERRDQGIETECWCFGTYVCECVRASYFLSNCIYCPLHCLFCLAVPRNVHLYTNVIDTKRNPTPKNYLLNSFTSLMLQVICPSSQ